MEYLKGSALVVRRKGDADTIPSWESEAARPIIYSCGRGDHVHELGLVRWCHDDHVRQASHVGDVESAAVSWPVRTHKTGSVQSKPNR